MSFMISVLRNELQSLLEAMGVTEGNKCVQMSTNQKNDSLVEENPVRERTVGPTTLKTITPVCNFASAKAAMVSPQYLHYSV